MLGFNRTYLKICLTVTSIISFLSFTEFHRLMHQRKGRTISETLLLLNLLRINPLYLPTTHLLLTPSKDNLNSYQPMQRQPDSNSKSKFWTHNPHHIATQSRLCTLPLWFYCKVVELWARAQLRRLLQE